MCVTKNLSRGVMLAAVILVTPALSHDNVSQAAKAGKDEGEVRWLAGDHHIHSRFSTGWDSKTTPPTPIVGEDALYPIPMNAVMARRFGLDWMVATDHGGPNHSKVSHDHSYPELLESRKAVPDLVQFFGMELNTPGADHSSIIIPAGPNEADRLASFELRFDAKEVFPLDPARNEESKMLEALKAADAQVPKPIVIAHHPSRSANALGQYGLTTPRELRRWNDTAPEVAIGMEGAPGHQAAGQMKERFAPSVYAGYFGKVRPRGAYGNYPTMGGFDQMTAQLGGFWDSMLGEGRRWWITATSDSHVHWTDGGADFWPGEYSKTYVRASKTHDAILASIRAGRVFVTTGDLVTSVDFTAQAAGNKNLAETGGTLKVPQGQVVKIALKITDPSSSNANGDTPRLARVDLIRGKVTGRGSNFDANSNPTTSVAARFTADSWQQRGDSITIMFNISDLNGNEYIRVRGTNTSDLEPPVDADGENAWGDLWFYTNPIFLEAVGKTKQ